MPRNIEIPNCPVCLSPLMVQEDEKTYSMKSESPVIREDIRYRCMGCGEYEWIAPQGARENRNGKLVIR